MCKKQSEEVTTLLLELEDYPKPLYPRYVLRNGKFGAYFHDRFTGEALPLEEVLEKLNHHEECKYLLGQSED